MTEKLNAVKANPIDIAQRSKRGIDAATSIHLSEKETRYIIDEQLRKAGWEVDTENLVTIHSSTKKRGWVANDTFSPSYKNEPTPTGVLSVPTSTAHSSNLGQTHQF